MHWVCINFDLQAFLLQHKPFLDEVAMDCDRLKEVLGVICNPSWLQTNTFFKEIEINLEF